MSRYLFVLFSLLYFPLLLVAQKPPVFEVKYSQALSVLRFLEASAKVSHYSPSYRVLIVNYFGEDNRDFKQIVKDFQAIRLDYTYVWDSYPDSRHSNRSTYDLINIAAVNAKNIDDFLQKVICMIPNEDYILLNKCMKKASVYHDDFLKGYDKKIKKQLKAYRPYQAQLTQIFSQVSQFYGTDWAKNVPFEVCLYPIPAKQGSTSATPHGNTLVCAFLADRENDYLERLGVVTHEMCHILYDGQPSIFQHNIEKWMKKSASPYRFLAYRFFDEGMATAIGNGWAYEKINKKIDPTSWYNDPFIDGFGHALYPLVKEYIDDKKTMDSIFVNRAISLFEEKFPKSIYEYVPLLNEVFVYGTMEDDKVAEISQVLRENFRMSSYSLSTPLMDEQSKQDYKQNFGTKVLLLERDFAENWTYLQDWETDMKARFTVIDGTPSTKQYFSFINKKGEAIIIILFDNAQTLQQIFTQMKTEKYIDLEHIFHELK